MLFLISRNTKRNALKQDDKKKCVVQYVGLMYTVFQTNDVTGGWGFNLLHSHSELKLYVKANCVET